MATVIVLPIKSYQGFVILMNHEQIPFYILQWMEMPVATSSCFLVFLVAVPGIFICFCSLSNNIDLPATTSYITVGFIYLFTLAYFPFLYFSFFSLARFRSWQGWFLIDCKLLMSNGLPPSEICFMWSTISALTFFPTQSGHSQKGLICSFLALSERHAELR